VQTKQIYYRLIALWVICEAMLGGIIHGLKLPVSGLIVGSSAVICICMIAYYYPVRGAIIKATVLVAIFKMMLSPQSPLPAYLAVFFQGLLGEAIFLNRKNFKVNCLLLATLALFESAVQRLLIMTILFGMEIWHAIDLFISGVTGQDSINRYSYYLAGIYVILHVGAGWLIGHYTAGLPEKIRNLPEKYFIDLNNVSEEVTNPNKKNRALNRLFLLMWIITALIFIHAFIDPVHPIIPNNLILKLLFRSALIVLTWIVIINPILMNALRNWLEKKKYESGSDIKEISMLLPVTRYVFTESWNLASADKGIKRLLLFFRIVVYNSLRNEK
jgi:hypothetical protein